MFDTDTSQAVDALYAIPPDMAHDEWVKVGMAFHAAGGDYDTWNEWSSGAASYQLSKARDAWRSFKPGGGVGAGTLFHIAGEYGHTRSGPPPDRAVIEARKAQAAAEKVAFDAQEAEQHQQAAEAAELLLKAAAPAPADHPYLVTKGIKPHGLRFDGVNLLVPMRDTAGDLYSLQRIAPDGDKRFQPSGQVKGCYFSIGKLTKADGVLIVAEGFATGASIHEATGQAVAVAFNAGNLLPVAEALRNKYPALRIIVAADDDVNTPGNPGVTKATEAARAVGGLLAVPDFGANRPDKATDFNDLHQKVGAAAVLACIEVAAMVSTGSTFPALEDDGSKVAEGEPDPHRNAPRPHDGCLYGLVGEVARAACAANKEVNPHAAGLAFMTVLAAGLGRGCYLAIGDDWHHPRLFALHVGRSGRGRKGTSTKLATRIARAMDERHPDVSFQRHSGGLSSREGLVMKIHDGFKDGKNDVEPIHDKRLWILESEFANTLHQTAREGNTLSAALRDAWDGTSIKPATKTAPVYASKPHINLFGHITPAELLDMMKARELSNGFANRFMMIWAEQGELDPFPSYTPKETIEVLADRLADVLRFAQADRYVDLDHTRLQLDTEAARRYAVLYRGEFQNRSGGEMVAGLLVRRAPYLLRLSMLFALTDKTTTITLQHLEAAHHWVRYWADSVAYLFASAAQEAVFEKTQETARRIVEYLGEVGSATRTGLSKDCFRGRINKTTLDAAIGELLRENPPAIEVEQQARKDGPGSGTKVYRKTTTNSANSAKCGAGAGLEPESEAARNVRTLRNEANASLPAKATTQDSAPDFAGFADFAVPENAGQSEAESQSSQTSRRFADSDAEDAEVF